MKSYIKILSKREIRKLPKKERLLLFHRCCCWMNTLKHMMTEMLGNDCPFKTFDTKDEEVEEMFTKDYGSFKYLVLAFGKKNPDHVSDFIGMFTVSKYGVLDFHINDFIVDETCRCGGVGRNMLERFRIFVKKETVTDRKKYKRRATIELGVLEDNTAAKHLYEDFGFWYSQHTMTLKI